MKRKAITDTVTTRSCVVTFPNTVMILKKTGHALRKRPPYSSLNTAIKRRQTLREKFNRIANHDKNQ